jgi:membrane-associated phospholipid phosphatase
MIARLAGLWVGLLAAGVLVGLAVEGNGFDGAVVRAAATDRTAAMTSAARVLTQLGGTGLDLIFAAVVVGLVVAGRRGDAAFVLVAAGGAMLLANAIKFLLARPRPAGGGLVSVSSYSWPSGHATSSIALYGALAVLALRRAPPAARPPIVAGLLVLLAVIGATRVYLGVHYPTDVVAGWVLGGAWLLGAARLGSAAGEPRPG